MAAFVGSLIVACIVAGVVGIALWELGWYLWEHVNIGWIG